MIQHVKAEDRHFRDVGWLQTYWLFSFSDYYDPENTHHGSLRVFNDDIVQPHTGFATHPHEEMEIISIILEGEITHKDSMGNEMVVRQNDVQRMTAGTGLQHSEMNHDDKIVAFFQIWILPDKKDLPPSYDQITFSPESWKNNLKLIASSDAREQSVQLNTEASIFRSNLDSTGELSYTPDPSRCQYIYVIDGELNVNGVSACSRAQLRIQAEDKVVMKAQNKTDFILIDVLQQ